MDVVKDYPYPVALPYRIVWDKEEESVHRVWAIPFTALQAVKLTTFPMVAQYLLFPSLEKPEREACDAINRAIAGIRHPYYSDWLTLLHTLIRHLGQLGI